MSRMIAEKRSATPTEPDLDLLQAASSYMARSKHARSLANSFASILAAPESSPTPERSEAQILEDRRRAWELRCGQAAESFMRTVHPTYRGCRIANYRASLREQREVVESVKEYLRYVAKNGVFRGGLVFYGKPGTGKDHLATGAGWLLARHRGLSVVWHNGWPLFQEFKKRVFGGGQSSQSFINSMLAPDVLIISDPMPKTQEPATSTDQELIYQILDQRQGVNRPTWFTMNVASLEEAGRRIGGPVVSRMEFEACVCECMWDDHRQNGKDFRIQ